MSFNAQFYAKHGGAGAAPDGTRMRLAADVPG